MTIVPVTSERLGFRNILCPSSHQVGQGSLGVSHQAKSRALADEYGDIEPHLWAGIGRARSGCGAARVGSTDQVPGEIEACRKMGIRAFLVSGDPHLDETKPFGTKVLPQLKTCSLPHEYGRVPLEMPATPLKVWRAIQDAKAKNAGR